MLTNEICNFIYSVKNTTGNLKDFKSQGNLLEV